MLRKYTKTLLAICLAVLISDVPRVASAEQMLTTMEVVENLSRKKTEEKVRSYLDRQEVQTELVKFGLSPTEVSSRVASLSDQELNRLSLQMEQAQYGGDVTGILIVVLLVIVIIYLVKRI